MRDNARNTKAVTREAKAQYTKNCPANGGVIGKGTPTNIAAKKVAGRNPMAKTAMVLIDEL